MKKGTYRALAATLSLIMILAASCGREGEKADTQRTSAVNLTESTTTAPSVEEPTFTEIEVKAYIEATVRVCYITNDQVVVMTEDSTLFGLPYDTATGALYDGSVKTSELALGDILCVAHSGRIQGGNPSSYQYIYDIIKTVDASDFCHESRGCLMVISVSDTSLLVHPRPQEVLDPAKVNPEECYEIDIAGLPIVDAQNSAGVLLPSELKPGDFVTVMDSGKRTADKPYRLASVFSVTRCVNVVEQMTVTDVAVGADSVILGDAAIPSPYFVRGDVLDMSGNVVNIEDVSAGDLFEIQYDGYLTASMPARFGHLHVIRRIKTAAQIAAEQAAQDALDALNRKVDLRGTVKEFDGSKLVWFGETAAPEEISYFACTMVNTKNAIITDAATGQTLTWDDLREGDYVAVGGSGGIAETAPSQWHTIYSITRLNRLCLEGTVSAVTSEGVTVACEDGKSRTVSVKQYYVRGVRFDVSSLLVGDKVRLDVNAADEAGVYSLHLIDREDAVPKETAEVITETFRVTKVGGMDVWMVRDLAYDATQIRFDESGVAVFDGDVAFGIKRVFHDTDGSIRPVSQLRQGDLITVAYSGVTTESEPAQFVTIHRITRVAE